MKRRSFIRGFIALGSCAACAKLGLASEEAPPHWEYRGEHGPDHWADLDHANAACSAGVQQSPIDLKGAIRAEIEPLSILWKKSTAKIANNGHTIQVTMPGGNILSRNGQEYELLQFHFHAPSEHLVDGMTYPMEIHFVHKNVTSGRLAVIGVFVISGEPNGTFAQIAQYFPSQEGHVWTVPEFTPTDLLPVGLQYWTYEGSLTTPPCSEIVTWLVASEPLLVDAGDIKRFTKIYSKNARRVLPVNRRVLLSSN